jgi:hypothetical protein
MAWATIDTEVFAARVARQLAGFGLHPAGPGDVPEARTLAADLIGGGVVSEADFARVHRRSRMALFLAREEGRLTGLLAFVPLTAAGTRAVREDRFDAGAPADEHIARPGDEVCALYGWGVAATTKDAARRLIEGARAVGRGPAAHLPTYARPTTEAGHRLMRERLEFLDLPGSRTGLVWSPSFLSKALAA